MSPNAESDIITKNNECVLHRQNAHEFVVFVTCYTFDVDLMIFCRFTLGTILYKNLMSTM